jgi:hypothetical protein
LSVMLAAGSGNGPTECVLARRRRAILRESRRRRIRWVRRRTSWDRCCRV